MFIKIFQAKKTQTIDLNSVTKVIKTLEGEKYSIRLEFNAGDYVIVGSNLDKSDGVELESKIVYNWTKKRNENEIMEI